MRCGRGGLGMLMLAAALVPLGCARQAEPPSTAEAAYAQMTEVLAPLEQPREQLPILEQFINDYPDTEQALSALHDVVYLRRHKLDDLTGALTVTRRTLDATKDPSLRFEIGLLLHDLTTQSGDPIDLRAVADELAAHRSLKFTEHLAVVEAAEKVEEWQLMLEHATAMEDLATPEAFRADYPEREFSDERVERSANRRRSWSLAYRAGALSHLGRLEEASAVFQQAEKTSTPTNYVGVPETPLNRYWGETELALGRPQRAAELVAADAVMGRDERAQQTLRAAYEALNGSLDGFDAYSWTTRQRLARQVDDVTLNDYSGEPVSLASTSGSVVLLAFWNPG